MNRREAIDFKLAFSDCFDVEKNAVELARAILSLPSDFFPLTAYYEDRKRRKRITQENVKALSEALLFPRVAPDGVRFGEFDLEKKGLPGLYVNAQWTSPRRVGLNSVYGRIPIPTAVAGGDSIGRLVKWALETAAGPLNLVHGSLELDAEWKDKLALKEPSPGMDLVAWMENPPPHPKVPPQAVTDVVWLNIFGKPYVDLIGRDKLLSSPAHKSMETSSGIVAIQISETPLDYGKTEYAMRCEHVKEHIGREYFFDWENPKKAYPMPRVDVKYAQKLKKYTEEDLEMLRKRAGIPAPPESTMTDEIEWIEGLHGWVDHNREHANAFVEFVGDKALDYSVDSLKRLDRFVLTQRRDPREADVQLVLNASAYLAQVLIRNSLPAGRATIRVDAKKDHAVVELPNGMVALPMARISNLWNLGKKEATYQYAKVLLGK